MVAAQRRVAVVGAGWAGLAAAVEAVTLGDAVTVYDMAPSPGGRARAVDVGGLRLDNGQHILIGAYRETLRLMALVGVDLQAALQRQPLRLRDADGRGLTLTAGSAYWAFPYGVMTQRGWPLRARIALLAQAARWRAAGFRCPAAQTVAEVTAALPPQVRRDLIEPLCVAALNTPADAASATVFLRVLKDAIFSGRGASDLLLPRTDLSALFPDPAWRWLAGHGADVRCTHRVQRLQATAQGWVVDGHVYDHVVIATSAGEAARLAGATAPAWAAVTARLPFEPIATVYVSAEGCRLPEPMLALASDDRSRPAQFVFDLGQLRRLDGVFAFVISGAGAWVARGTKAIAAATVAQATETLGAASRRPPAVLRVITEKRATLRCVPLLQRPGRRIAPGLSAAGDYVDGPYPSTLEGAVRSGIAAVRD